MSVDHNLVIQTKFNNLTQFADVLKNILKAYPIKGKINIEVKKYEHQEHDFFDLIFNISKNNKKQTYRISVVFGCDSDYENYGLNGKKIILIMNEIGDSRNIIEHIGNNLHSYGKIFIRYQDTDDYFSVYPNKINYINIYKTLL